jgi:ABC-type nitrate/sulfonate/bicarbonate transport system substrate-binding protein
MNSSHRQADAKAPALSSVRLAVVRCLLATGALAAVAALVAGCSPGAERPRDAKAESITVVSASGLIRGLIIMASEKGLFAAQGLDVTVKSSTAGSTTLDAVARGEADVGLSASVPFVMAILDNQDLRLLARVFRSRTYVSIVARKDRGIEHAADLAGKSIGLVPGATPDYFTDLYLGVQGIGPGKYTRVALAVDQLESALLNGDVDAVAAQHPYNSRLIAKLGPQAVEFSDPALYQLRIDLVARPGFAKLRPDTARRFMLALKNALLYLSNYPDEAKHIVLDATKGDPAVEGRIWEESDFSLTLDQSLLSGLEDEAHWALAKRGATQEKLPNFLDYIDAWPLQSVQPGAVTILLP